MPNHNLKRRLAALERQVPESAPRSELAELIAHMSLDELDILHGIAGRVDANGKVHADDIEEFGAIYVSAMERRNKGEPPMQRGGRSAC